MTLWLNLFMAASIPPSRIITRASSALSRASSTTGSSSLEKGERTNSTASPRPARGPIPPRAFPPRHSAHVHVCRGLGQDQPFLIPHHFRDLGREFPPPELHVPAPGQPLDDGEADVVPRPGIAPPGGSQADHDPQRFLLLLLLFFLLRLFFLIRFLFFFRLFRPLLLDHLGLGGLGGNGRFLVPLLHLFFLLLHCV